VAPVSVNVTEVRLLAATNNVETEAMAVGNVYSVSSALWMSWPNTPLGVKTRTKTKVVSPVEVGAVGAVGAVSVVFVVPTALSVAFTAPVAMARSAVGPTYTRHCVLRPGAGVTESVDGVGKPATSILSTDKDVGYLKPLASFWLAFVRVRAA
jgi:hypothetical protein